MRLARRRRAGRRGGLAPSGVACEASADSAVHVFTRHASQSVFRVPKNSRAKKVLARAPATGAQRVHAVERRGPATLAGRRKPSPRGPPPAGSRPSETWQCPAQRRNRQPHGRGRRKAQRKLALPGRYRGRATGRSTAGSPRPPTRWRARTGRTGPRGSWPDPPTPRHRIADSQSPHEHRQHGGRRRGGGAEQQPKLAEPRHLKDQPAHPREKQQPRYRPGATRSTGEPAAATGGCRWATAGKGMTVAMPATDPCSSFAIESILPSSLCPLLEGVPHGPRAPTRESGSFAARSKARSEPGIHRHLARLHFGL